MLFSLDWICICIFLIYDMSFSKVWLAWPLYDVRAMPPLFPCVLLAGKAPLLRDFCTFMCCLRLGCWFRLVFAVTSCMLWFWVKLFWFELYRVIVVWLFWVICPLFWPVFLALPPRLLVAAGCGWRDEDEFLMFCWELFLDIFCISACCWSRYCCCFRASWDCLTAFLVAEFCCD